MAEPVPDPRSTTHSTWAGPRRRLTSSTVALVAIVALEVAALAVLGVHLVSGSGEVATVSSSPTYAPPVSLPSGTAFVRSSVIAPDTLVVTHWIHTESGVSSVRIRVPQVAGLAPGAVAVSDLVVVSDGRSIPEATLPHGRGVQTYIVPPGRHIFVSYVLTGAIQSSGSRVRATAMVTALRVATPAAPVTRTIHSLVGARVLALACSPSRPKAVARPCGRELAGGWRVDLRSVHSGDRVTAQLDLS